MRLGSFWGLKRRFLFNPVRNMQLWSLKHSFLFLCAYAAFDVWNLKHWYTFLPLEILRMRIKIRRNQRRRHQSMQVTIRETHAPEATKAKHANKMHEDRSKWKTATTRTTTTIHASSQGCHILRSTKNKTIHEQRDAIWWKPCHTHINPSRGKR